MVEIEGSVGRVKSRKCKFVNNDENVNMEEKCKWQKGMSSERGCSGESWCENKILISWAVVLNAFRSADRTAKGKWRENFVGEGSV